MPLADISQTMNVSSLAPAELPPPPPNAISELENSVLGAQEEPVVLETYVDLSDQELTEIPRLQGEITHLRLDTNLLRTVESLTLPDFTRLGVLDLSFNAITELSPVFGKLVLLRELYLSHNALTDLPEVLGCLTQLEILDVSANQLYRITNSIGKLTALHHLDLRYNRLESLPYALGVLESRLFTLLIDNNPYGEDFRELVGPLLATEPPVNNYSSQAAPMLNNTPTKPANRWRKLRSAMRKSMSMEPAEARRSPRTVSMDARHLSSPREEEENPFNDESAAVIRKLKKLSTKSSPGASPPAIPAKNPRRFVKSLQQAPPEVDETLMERPAFDNRRCQTLDGFVFIADSGPTSPSLAELVLANQKNNISNGIDPPASPTLKKLGYSQLGPPDTNQDDAPFSMSLKRSSRASMLTHSSSSSSSGMSVVTAPPSLHPLPPPPPGELQRDSGYSTDHQRAPLPDLMGDGLWPHLPIGGHQLPSHSKLIEFLRRLRDYWDLSPESSEAAQVLQHRRQVKAIGEREEEEIVRGGGVDISDKDQLRRRNIMAEILSTEETYVKSLQALETIYIAGAEQRQLFSPEETRQLFGNVQSILLFHKQYLLPEIRREMGTPDPQMGEVFATHSAYLKMYSLYVNDFDVANAEVERLQALASISSGVGSAARHRKRIRTYLEACAAHPAHNQLNLQGFLLLPVQRIPRYRLLLMDLLKCTPASHPDRSSLVKAYAEIARRADEINERKRVKEANDKVLEIQNRIKGHNQVPLVEPHRRFIKEGPLHLRQIVSLRHCTIPGHAASFQGPNSPPPRGSSLPNAQPLPPPSRLVLRALEVKLDFVYILFNDIMIQCKPTTGKPTGHNDLELNRVFELGSKLKPARLVNARVLRVVDNKTIYYFMGPTEELVAWANAINNR